MTKSKMDPDFALKIPKIELHLHLDGSLSPEFIFEEAKKQNLELPIQDPKDLRRYLQEQKRSAIYKNANKVGQGQNWSIFDFCNQFLQTFEKLELATLDLLNRLADFNVVYAEVRFCPALHTKEKLTSDQAVQAVLSGFRRQNRVEGGVIICALRSKDSQHALDMADLAGKYLQIHKNDPIGVLGFDVAGDEGSFPLKSVPDSMTKGVVRAQELKVPVTLHAGEWPEKFGSLDNVKFAIDELKVQRIGHGITLRSDLEYLKKLKNSNVTIEVCLTSNIGYGFKVNSYEDHPVKLFHQFGVPFSFSMDNWLLSGDLDNQPNPDHELIEATEIIGLAGNVYFCLKKIFLIVLVYKA